MKLTQSALEKIEDDLKYYSNAICSEVQYGHYSIKEIKTYFQKLKKTLSLLIKVKDEDIYDDI